MSLQRVFSIRGIAVTFGVLLVSVAAYGFAASNVVPESRAGDGSEAISGYTVSNVSYTLNATDPSTIEKVSFSLDETVVGTAVLPTDVQAQIVSGTGSWYDCTTVDIALPAAYDCAISPAVAASTADQLRVVAAD
jgi:hypothetical protein